MVKGEEVEVKGGWNAEEKGKKAKGKMFRSEVKVGGKQEKAKVNW